MGISEESRLVLRFSQEGGAQQLSMMQSIASQAKLTELSISQLQASMRKSVSGGILDANFLTSSQSAMDKLISSSNREGQAILGITTATNANTTATKENIQGNQQSGESFGSLALKIAGYSSALNLGIGIAREAVSGLVDLGKQAVELAGQFERSRVAWGVFLKDVDAGSQMFDQLYDLAQRTPLSFQGVESAAQTLKGFGLQTKEIIPTLERMGDVARGNDETMQRLALAYGQALAQGRVLTRDLYQFVNAGVPIFEALGTVMHKSVTEVQALVTEGKVGFPEIEAALKSLTGAGGQFEGMMEKASTTYEGKLSIAKDNWKAMLAEMGKSLQDSLKAWLDDFNNFADKTLGKTNIKTVIASSGASGNIQTAIAWAQANPTQLEGVIPPGYAPNITGQTTGITLQEQVLGILRGLQKEKAQTALEAGRLDAPSGYKTISSLNEWSDYNGQYATYDGKLYHAEGRKWVPVEETPQGSDWRTVISEATGIDTSARPVYKNGKIVDWKKPTGSQVAKEWIDQNTADFSQFKGTPLESSWRSEFGAKATAVLKKLLEAKNGNGDYIWNSDENTIKLFEHAIADFGTQKKNNKKNDIWSDEFNNYASAIQYKKPVDEMARWRDVNQYFVDKGANPNPPQTTMDYLPATWGQRISELEEKFNTTPKITYDENRDYWSKLNERFGGVKSPSSEILTPEEIARNADIMTQLMGTPSEESLAYAAKYRKDQSDYSFEKLQKEFTVPRYGERATAPEGFGERSDYREQTFALSKQDIEEASAKVLEMMTPSDDAKAYADKRTEEYYDWLISKLQEEFNSKYKTQSSLGLLYNNGGKTGNILDLGPGESIQDQIFSLNHNGMSFNEWVDYKNETFVPGLYAEDYKNQGMNALGGNTKSTEIYPWELLEMNRKALEGPANRAIDISPRRTGTINNEYVNSTTGDINGYYFDDSMQSGKIQYALPVTDAEKYSAALESLNEQLDNGTISQAGYDQELQNLKDQYDPATKKANEFSLAMKNAGMQILETGVSALSDELYSLGEALADGSASWDSFGDSMGNVLETILKMIPKLAIQIGLQLIPTQPEIGLALVAAGLVGQISAGALGDSGYASGTTGAQTGWHLVGENGPELEYFHGGETVIPNHALKNSTANAFGGIYDSPSLHQYSNGIYDRPQMFTFAQGGVFAEAGPEAIMPLSRDSTGKLGVAGSNVKVDVQVINQSSTPVSKKTTTITDAAGNKKIMVWLKDVVKQEVATANAGGVRKS